MESVNHTAPLAVIDSKIVKQKGKYDGQVASVLEKIKLSNENSKWKTASAICNQVIYFIHEDKADTGEGGNADNPQKD